jgi:hypothetical protein
MSATYKHSVERSFHAHHMLLRIAGDELETVKRAEPLSPDRCLVVMTFTALALESLANSIGEKVVEGWDDFENLRPIAKLRFLAEHLELPYASDKEPWLTLKQVFRFRNQIAHAKSEIIKTEKIINETQLEKLRLSFSDPPKSKLEDQLTLGNATRFVETARAVEKMFYSKLSDSDNFDIASKGWVEGTERLPVL